jgi:hypothetical protein
MSTAGEAGLRVLEEWPLEAPPDGPTWWNVCECQAGLGHRSGRCGMDVTRLRPVPIGSSPVQETGRVQMNWPCGEGADEITVRRQDDG